MWTRSPRAIFLLLGFAIQICLLHFAVAENLPDLRPALVGSGSNSLVNMIDAASLLKKGQGDAAICFVVLVLPHGETSYFALFSSTPGSDTFKVEVRMKLWHAHFIPAVYHHQHVAAEFSGTVMYFVIDGKPHVRVFANHEPAELKQQSDLIAAQPIHEVLFFPRTRITPYFSALQGSVEGMTGAADLHVTTDATGQLKDVHLFKEAPPEHSFGTTAMDLVKHGKFIPSFRHGEPVESTVSMPVWFSRARWGE